MPALTPEQIDISVAFLQKLQGLRIKATLERVEPGPVVSGFYFKLANSEPISKIINKSEDFALAAGVEKVTITRHSGEIAIFAANKERKLIEFKKYLDWYLRNEEVQKMKIPIPLGVDSHGSEKALDLSEMPHILLAGETGSGKSVFEASIISSLACAKNPRELQIILVDTKQLDLPLFSTLPHVKATVTDLDGFHNMMDGLLFETYRRMGLLKNASVRNISEYHTMTSDNTQIPYIMVIIDEFADLLEQDKAWRKTIETDRPPVDTWLKRLVQISRAAGIHVIAGTQRTSVKVVSGDIKANFPCRISLRLPTEFDSRTILGTDGAETLLGKGDMLVQMPNSEALRRYHGPFVHLGDIGEITVQNEMIREMYANLRSVKV